MPGCSWCRGVALLCAGAFLPGAFADYATGLDQITLPTEIDAVIIDTEDDIEPAPAITQPIHGHSERF